MIDGILARRDDRTALIAPSENTRLTYAELGARVDALASGLREAAGGERCLVFLAPGPDLHAALFYLACLKAGLPVCLAEPQAAPLARLAEAYRPALVLVPDTLAVPEGWRAGASLAPGYVVARAASPHRLALHPDLALLLTTSGSTGSPKLVRLAERSLDSNARRIGEYLGLGPDERAIQSLPIYYSYGLSVLNSHLLAGASVILTPHSFMRPEFWRDVDEQQATSFAGVPYMYETLHRLRFDPARHPSLRTFTQAGGALRRDLVEHFKIGRASCRERV